MGDAPESATMPAASTPVAATPTPGSQEAASGPERQAPLGLSPDELALLDRLLDGGGAQAGASLSGIPLTMVVDDINERLFDTLGDTALEFDGDEPHIIEDYLEDVRRAIARD